MITRWILVGLMVALGAFAPAQAEVPSMDDPQASYGSEANYTIYRKGKKVGTHQLMFSATAEGLAVKVRSRITVRILKIPVFRFGYEATENWQDGKLQSVVATTRENGEISTVTLDSSAQLSTISGTDGTRNVPRITFASNHWAPGVINAKRVFNTLTGGVSKVQVKALGPARFKTVSGTTNAHHYRYSGDIEADVWYDETGRWIGLRFLGTDDSTITYRAEF